MKDVDLYIDVPTNYLIDPKHLMAQAIPGKLIEGFDRFRITIRLDNKYFESPVKGDAIVQEFKKVKNANN